MEALFGLIGLIIAGVLLRKGKAKERRRTKELADSRDFRSVRADVLAKRLGLRALESIGDQYAWEGGVDGLKFHLRCSATRVTMRLALPTPPDGRAVGRFLFGRRRPGRDDDHLGFPEALLTQGVPAAGPLPVALLSQKGRLLLTDFVTPRPTASPPKLYWGEVSREWIEANELADDDRESWQGLLDRMLLDCQDVASHIRRTTATLPESLRDVGSESAPRLRAVAIEQLMVEFPTAPGTREFAAEVALDASYALGSQLLSATVLGAAADELVCAWCASVPLASEDRDRMRDALEGVLSRVDLDGIEELLARTCGGATDPSILVWLAGALVDAGLAEGERCGPLERLLIGELDQPDAERATAAVEALGEVGTALAVGPLRATRATGAKRAAAEAVRQIQGRLVHASPGQLSVSEADDAAGRLSAVEVNGGELSLEPTGAGPGAEPPGRSD